MIKLTKILLVDLLLFIGCTVDSTLYLNGGKETIGAEVFIDSINVGKMTKILDGSEFKVKIAPGEHELLVLGVKGERFFQKFKIQGENYISVQFDRTDNSEINSETEKLNK